MKTYISILILVFLFGSSGAQDITVNGRVFESHTEEPLPFTNVFYQGTNIGTVTDLEGNFSITGQRASDSLVVSAIGYESKAIYVNFKAEQHYLFEMERKEFNLSEVTVVPGENPAHALMEKIWLKRDQNNKESLESFSYEVYNKIEVDIDEITDDFMEKRWFKPFKFIFDNIDSLSEDKPFLPMFFTETLSEFYYQSSPKTQKEVIIASKMSGVKNESVTQFLGGMYQDINIYQNWIPILSKQFVSPISLQGMAYYRYYIVDSGTIDKKWCYQVNFVPRNKADNTFTGDFWVNDSSFAIKRLSMQAGKHVNLNFVEKLSVFQEFVDVNGTWMMTKDKLIVDFVTTDQTPSLIGRKTTSFAKYKINDKSVGEFFMKGDDIVISEDVFNKDEQFWKEARHESLSENEESIYHMVDTLQKIPLFKTYVDIITILVTGYKVVGNFEFGPYFNIYSNNEVEKHRFRVGARTSNKFSTRWMLGGHLAYGTFDQKWKYGGYTQYFLTKNPRLSIGGEYKYDINVSSANKDEFGQDNIFSGFYRKAGEQRLIMIEEQSAYIDKEWNSGYSNKISFSNRNLDPYFQFGYIKNAGDPDIADTLSTLTTSEVIVTGRFAYKENFVSGEFERISLGTKYPVIQIQTAFGVKGVLGSQFKYQRIEFNLSDNFPINPIGSFHYTVAAGKIFGNLPYLLLEVHPGNITYFYNKYSFNNMNLYEFVSDAFVKVYFTHYFEGFLLNRIPLMKKLKWRLLVDGKAVLGSLSAENEKGNDLILNDIKVPNKEPYAEAGLGIENIFRIFRLDGTWRLTHLGYTPSSITSRKPSKFSLRFSAQLKF